MGKEKHGTKQKASKKSHNFVKNKKKYSAHQDRKKEIILSKKCDKTLTRNDDSETSYQQPLRSSPKITKSYGKGLSKLQQAFKNKLEGARFRVINERLYTCRGEDAFEEFQKDKNLFDVYHEGYREQTLSWPSNPLDIIIDWIRTRHSTAIVADFGCGEARLAHTLKKQKVHSFDLVSKNAHVIPCDIANVPLANKSVDIVVFCLSLMGTNIGDFLLEANRVLKIGGHIKIAEVKSRFQEKNLESKEGINGFMGVLKSAGFKIVHKDFSNKMFFLVEGVKVDKETDVDMNYSIKPCLYKKR